MSSQRSLGALGVVGAALVFSVTACGDQPTANRDFYAVATHSSRTETLPQPGGFPVPYIHDVLTGHLIDAQQRPVANSLFYEDCASARSAQNQPDRPTQCTVVVKTGPKTYASRGSGLRMAGGTGNYYGMMGSLASAGSLGPGSSVTWILPNGSGASPYKLKISIRLWGAPPVATP